MSGLLGSSWLRWAVSRCRETSVLHRQTSQPATAQLFLISACGGGFLHFGGAPRLRTFNSKHSFLYLDFFFFIYSSSSFFFKVNNPSQGEEGRKKKKEEEERRRRRRSSRRRRRRRRRRSRRHASAQQRRRGRPGSEWWDDSVQRRRGAGGEDPGKRVHGERPGRPQVLPGERVGNKSKSERGGRCQKRECVCVPVCVCVCVCVWMSGGLFYFTRCWQALNECGERSGEEKERNAFRVTVSEISRRGDLEGVYFRTGMPYQQKENAQ